MYNYNIISRVKLNIFSKNKNNFPISLVSLHSYFLTGCFGLHEKGVLLGQSSHNGYFN